jgi:hypothetical protein
MVGETVACDAVFGVIWHGVSQGEIPGDAADRHSVVIEIKRHRGQRNNEF